MSYRTFPPLVEVELAPTKLCCGVASLLDGLGEGREPARRRGLDAIAPLSDGRCREPTVLNLSTKSLSPCNLRG